MGMRQLLPDFSHKGFTLVELLVSLCLSGFIFGMIVSVFASQQDSYLAQTRMMALQQNLRVAMNIISNDIRMAGYRASSDMEPYEDYVDWDPRKSGTDLFYSRIHGIDNLVGIKKYKEQSDVLFIVKASLDSRKLEPMEYVFAGDKQLHLKDYDFNQDGNEDLNTTGKRYGLMTRSDLGRSQLFKIIGSDPTLTVMDPFRSRYGEGDFIARADVIIYRVDDDNTSFSQAVLERKNAGNGNRFQVVAEGVTDLQLRYVLRDGSIVDDPEEQEENVVSVEVRLTGKALIGRSETRHRTLVTVLTIRNV